MHESTLNNASSDVLIVGSGLAALSLALSLPTHLRIALIHTPHSASTQAQGGIGASPFHQSEKDSQAHIDDTRQAGDGACNEAALHCILEDSHTHIKWLESLGVRFDQDGHTLNLRQEGGHHARRIVYVKDYTGRAMMDALLFKLQSQKHIRMISARVLGLAQNDTGRVQGAWIAPLLGASNPDHDELSLHSAHEVVLASGGNSGIYPKNTYQSAQLGSGIIMAAQCGALIENPEFVQFHPTAFINQENKAVFLVSEAVRGEGGTLCIDGVPFMEKFHTMGSMAPRDVVARSILSIMQKHQKNYVDLDATSLPQGLIEEEFPSILSKSLDEGVDPRSEPIPVAPAAHYTIGGIQTNLNAQSNIEGLWAIGECASTGLHGANRLAGNSLLECVVMGRRAGKAMGALLKNELKTKELPQKSPTIQKIDANIQKTICTLAPEAITPAIETLHQILDTKLGAHRTKKGIHEALLTLEALQHTWFKTQTEAKPKEHQSVKKKNLDTKTTYAKILPLDANARMLYCILHGARLIATGAHARKESRGTHHIQEHPKRTKYYTPTLLHFNF